MFILLGITFKPQPKNLDPKDLKLTLLRKFIKQESYTPEILMETLIQILESRYQIKPKVAAIVYEISDYLCLIVYESNGSDAIDDCIEYLGVEKKCFREIIDLANQLFFGECDAVEKVEFK